MHRTRIMNYLRESVCPICGQKIILPEISKRKNQSYICGDCALSEVFLNDPMTNEIYYKFV